MKLKKISIILSLLFVIIIMGGCKFDPSKFYPEPKSHDLTEPASRYLYIGGFTNKQNQDLRNFIKSNENYKGRKIAVFSIDGALINQTPYYASDEAMYLYAKNNPAWNSEILKKVNTAASHENKYIENKTLYWSGLSVDQVEEIGNKTLRKHYSFFPEMFDFLGNLKTNNFEIWLITSSPEVLYQKFFSDYLGIPENRIIGSKTVIEDGKLTENFIQPYLNREGKKGAVETFIKARPLIVVGHSYSDIDMLSYSKNIKVIVNPNNKEEHKSLGDKCVDEYAVNKGWLILDLKDVPTERSKGMVSGEYNIKENDDVDV